MKRIICLVLASLAFLPAEAKCSHSHHGHHSMPRSGYHYHHAASSSGPSSYLVNTEHRQERQEFPDCAKHYAITDIRTDYYSNGQRNIYKNSTIYNSDGTILISDCQDFEHFIYNKEHYFIIRKQGKYQIYNTSAQIIFKKQYSRLKLIKENRILAGIDKQLGIIDLKENVIVPIKYQKLIPAGNNIFITKLNRYFGLIDTDNNIILKNNCEKIKQSGNYIVVKKYGKYGLYDYKAKKILDINYDKIKILNGYILVKSNDLYGAINVEDNSISKIEFNKIKQIRNQLYGFKGKEKVLLFEM